MRREFRKQGAPYSYAVDFLEEQGAFDYINNGNLKKGTKVYFVASNEYWDYLREKGSDDSYLQNNKPLLIVIPHENGRLTINGQNYQVLGTFKKTLNPFIQKAVQDNIDSVDTSISTTVTQVTPGRISMGSERSLSSIISNESPALFGISTGSGNIETNGTNHDVLNVNTGNEDAGRLYLLVEGANGTRIPVAVRGKRLGEMTQEEIFSDNDFFNELHKAIRNVAEKSLELTEESLDGAVKTLRNILFVGSKAGIPIRARNYTNGPMTEYGITIGDHFISIATRDMTINDGALNSKSIVDISGDILAHLIFINTPFQINKSNINSNWNVNGKPYNNILIKSGILTTNVTSNSVRGAFFKMNPIGNNLKEITEVSNISSSNTNNPSKKATTNINNDNVSNKGDVTVSWEGSNYTLNKKGQIFDANGNLIQAKDNITSKIVNGVKVTNYLNSLSVEELAKISFTGKELFPGSMFSVNNYIELPSGQVWNGNIVVSKE